MFMFMIMTMTYTRSVHLINCGKKNLKLLLLKDQLIKQRQSNQVFYNFQEADINFNPTYRRIKGTDEYSNKNNQSPSWCDRIMVKTDREINFYKSTFGSRNIWQPRHH